MLMGFVVWILIGAVAGWLAGLIVKGGGFGFVANAVIGIVGAALAGLVLPRFGFPFGTGFVGETIRAVIGSVMLLILLSLVPLMRR